MSEASKVKSFEAELASLINKYNMENGSNTPDFIIANYLVECLKTFNQAAVWRERWYSVKLEPCQEINGEYRKCVDPQTV